MSSKTASGPRAYPMIGHLPKYLPDKLGFLLNAAEAFGDIVELKIGEKTFLLNNAEDIKYVLTQNPRNFEKSQRMTGKRGKRLSGEGLLTISSNAHLRQRRMMQPVFHHKSIAALAAVMIKDIEQWLDKLNNTPQVNIADEMMRLAQYNIFKALFGKDVEAVVEEISEAVFIRQQYINYVFGSLFPFPEYLPAGINRKYQKAIEVLDDFIYGVIRSRRASPASTPDLVTMLLQTEYEDGSKMSNLQIRDEALTFSLTGFETIGEALTWTNYLLSQHPDIEAKLLAEIGDVLGNQAPDLQHLPRLAYTEMVIAESMRLYPPTWIFIRMAKAAATLPGGTAIPAGAKMYMCPYVVHRNPKYFPVPEKFDPERFTAAEKKKRPRFSYFPFGGGPRLCIGEAFAKMEMVFVLAMLKQRYQFTLCPNQNLAPFPGITLRPKNGMMMDISKRKMLKTSANYLSNVNNDLT